MRITHLASSVSRIATPAARVASGVGAGVLVLMMFLSAMDVLLRYFLNSPISGAMELTQYMMLVTVVSGLAYCTVDKAHIRVEVLIERCPQRMRTVLYAVTSLLTFVFFLLIVTQSFRYAKMLFESNLTSPVLFIPAYPFAIALALGLVVFCLALIAEFLHFLSKAVTE